MNAALADLKRVARALEAVSAAEAFGTWAHHTWVAEQAAHDAIRATFRLAIRLGETEVVQPGDRD